jgi:hypothetical protein
MYQTVFEIPSKHSRIIIAIKGARKCPERFAGVSYSVVKYAIGKTLAVFHLKDFLLLQNTE